MDTSSDLSPTNSGKEEDTKRVGHSTSAISFQRKVKVFGCDEDEDDLTIPDTEDDDLVINPQRKALRSKYVGEYSEEDEDGGEEGEGEGEDDDDDDAEARDNLSSHEFSSLPSFRRRPLSDTPVTSVWNSPSGSAETTPTSSRESSTLSLVQLNQALVNSKINANLNKKVPYEDNNSTPKEPVSPKSPSPSIVKSPSQFYHPKRRPTTIDVPGLTKSKTSPDGLISKEDPGSKLIIVMVGLPATGKSFITNKLSRYLNYSMYYCRVFNVGNTRRKYAKEHGLSEQDSSFFDPTNTQYTDLRDKWALDTLEELMDYLLEGPGSVGVFDATNTTKERRKHVLERIRARSPHLKVLFLESICTNKAVVETNIRLKLFGPDYKGKDPEKSLRDFKERLSNYIKAYEPIEDDEDIQYIKMIDVGKKVIANKIQGFLASQTVYYLLNFNLKERQIWITRNSESQDNVLGRLGGDSHITSRGDKYAKALAKFIDEQRAQFFVNEMEKNKKGVEQLRKLDEGRLDKNDVLDKDELPSIADLNQPDQLYNEFFVWTSMLHRAIETAKYFNEDEYPIKQMRMLDEISAGDYEGMTFPEIQAKFPQEFAERQRDKLRYRYPGIGGESYLDVINRLRPVITEIERIQDSVLIITHRVVARALLGYFMNLSVDIISNLDVPLHSVYCLETKPYGITWALWEYDEDKDTFFKVPEYNLNTKRVKEVDLVNNERRYSVIPTAPPSKHGSKPGMDRRMSNSSNNENVNHNRNDNSNAGNSSNMSNSGGFKPKFNMNPVPTLGTGGLMPPRTMVEGGGTSISTGHRRPPSNNKGSILLNKDN
ncbi:6-phosphofructo-2-kinase/fructose-2,6-bisphosphatase [Nakaseomyces bracarensis]|uniref:6-phosphofructo-2-kinase/fructose-2, 6-bisphosphatase n=1 Tax=Nakaseomyces bracarensis TaxID=273131 RepID=UPI003871CFC5